MAVPAAKLLASPGVVIHLRGGATPPVPPPCRKGPPAFCVYLRRTASDAGSADASYPDYPDLYYVPPDVAAAKQLAPGWYTTLDAGDEFEVLAAPLAAGRPARDRLYAAMAPTYELLGIKLLVDGHKTESFDFMVPSMPRHRVKFRGWKGEAVGGTYTYHRFCAARTPTAPAAAPAGAVGTLVTRCAPMRRTGGTAAVRSAAPAVAPVALPERDAMKDRSLSAAAGAAVATRAPTTFFVKRGDELPAEEVAIAYRERRVLVTRGVLLKDGSVVPSLRGGGGCAADGASAKTPPRSVGGGATAATAAGAAAPAVAASATPGSTRRLSSTGGGGSACKRPRGEAAGDLRAGGATPLRATAKVEAAAGGSGAGGAKTEPGAAAAAAPAGASSGGGGKVEGEVIVLD